jgi:hypothetical protein
MKLKTKPSTVMITSIKLKFFKNKIFHYEECKK